MNGCVSPAGIDEVDDVLTEGRTRKDRLEHVGVVSAAYALYWEFRYCN